MIAEVNHEVVDEAFGYLIPAFYPHSLEFHNVDVQSNGQKANCGNIFLCSHTSNQHSERLCNNQTTLPIDHSFTESLKSRTQA